MNYLAFERHHLLFEAPGADVPDKEMEQFISWFNSKTDMDPVIKAAITHLWLSPFILSMMAMVALPVLLPICNWLVPMEQINASTVCQPIFRKERNAYYQILEKTQKGTLDITQWLEKFLYCLNRSLAATEHTLSGILRKAHCWEDNGCKILK